VCTKLDIYVFILLHCVSHIVLDNIYYLPVTGRMIPICEYHGIDILDGSTFRTANCMDCKCSNAQLACCG
jgi:hypothetical protein